MPDFFFGQALVMPHVKSNYMRVRVFMMDSSDNPAGYSITEVIEQIYSGYRITLIIIKIYYYV